MLIAQLAVLFAFLAAGEFIVWLTGIPVPSSIIGMLMLTAALHFAWIDIRRVEGVARFLVDNLGFFFVPAGVGLLGYFDLVRDQWMPIVCASVLSTFIVIGVTGQVHQIMRRRLARRGHRRSPQR
ncbi:MAG: CidA/LrgA family protein [Duncaniella sp.]|nr:CidA/LrgA family protein [Duncaniella sp.]